MVIHVINSIRAQIHRIIDWILVILLIPITLGTFIQVVLRYGFRKTLPQVNEIATVMFVWLSIIAAAKVLDKESHPAFTMVVEKVPGKIRDIIRLIDWTVIFGILVIVVKGSLRLLESGRGQTLSTMNISYNWVYASLLVGSLFMIIISAFKILEIIMHLLGKGGEINA
ncbi:MULTISPECIES: TRAP transporter small permease [Thermococcus]|uniref:TRAP transporter small permease n=1 Tax=Thermococcus TaxID=2263 RepID=UPI0015C4F03F|nr:MULTISPECIES: TRAP transporter small permease subunit [Thermococcus]MCA6214129.1 TRAP transporter small permease subunit [Thermococcus bergensis]